MLGDVVQGFLHGPIQRYLQIMVKGTYVFREIKVRANSRTFFEKFCLSSDSRNQPQLF
jgi:hypothetical protein